MFPLWHESFPLGCRGLAPFPRGSLCQTVFPSCVVLTCGLLLGTCEQLRSPVLQPCPCSPPSVCFSVDCRTGISRSARTRRSPQSRVPAFPPGAVFAVGSHLLRALSGHVISITWFSTRAWASLGSSDAAVFPPDKATFGFCCRSRFSQILDLGQYCFQL